MYKNIYIANKCHAFELSVRQRVQENIYHNFHRNVKYLHINIEYLLSIKTVFKNI